MRTIERWIPMEIGNESTEKNPSSTTTDIHEHESSVSHQLNFRWDGAASLFLFSIWTVSRLFSLRNSSADMKGNQNGTETSLMLAHTTIDGTKCVNANRKKFAK